MVFTHSCCKLDRFRLRVFFLFHGGNTTLKSSNLTSVVSLLAAGAEAARRQDEDLLGDGVDLPDALVVVDDRHRRFTDSERARSS